MATKRKLVRGEQTRGNAADSFNSEDKLAHVREQGQAQFESIREMVEDLEKAREAVERDDAPERTGEQAVEEAERAIHEDALSVEVRSGWYSPGDVHAVNGKLRPMPAEYRILLCTGGPACQIRGELSEHGEPETARMEVQDWFTPWTAFRPAAGDPERLAENAAKREGWRIRERQGDRCFVFERVERGEQVDDFCGVTWGELCEYVGIVGDIVDAGGAEAVLLAYARCFWFGE